MTAACGPPARSRDLRERRFPRPDWVAEDFGDSSGDSSTTWRYIAIRATEEIRAETLDIAAIVRDLVGRGLIGDQDYLNGYEFGAEVIGGRGKLKLNEISHEFSTTANSEASTEVSAAETQEFALL